MIRDSFIKIMTQKTYLGAFFLIGALLHFSGQSQAKAGPMPAGSRLQNKTVEKLFWVSGLNTRYQDVEGSLARHKKIHPEALQGSQEEFAKNLMRHGKGPSHIRESMKKEFLTRFDQSHAEASIKWFHSQAGQKILETDREALSPDIKRGRKASAKAIMRTPPNESRLLVVERIEAAEALSANIKSLCRAYVDAVFPFNNRMKGKRLVKVMRMLKDEIAEPVRNQVLRRKLFAYRSIKDKDLRAYASFLESPAGQWFTFSELRGFEKGIKKTLANVHKAQRELLIELDQGGPEFPLLKKLAPAGQRYLLVQLRDSFKPLFTESGPVQTEEAAPLSSARQFGSELENTPPIALYVMDKIKKQRPGLYRKMKFYERLFNKKEDLKLMSGDEYADAVEAYRTVLEKAGETKVSKTPLQEEYKKLKLTGIISKNTKTLALVETTDKKGHVVSEGDLIGPRFGFVNEIQPEKIIVIEKSRDYLGNILTRQRTIGFLQKI